MLMHSDLDAWRRAFKRLVIAAVFHLAGANAALDVHDTAFFVAMQIGITAGARVCRTADRYGQRMTRFVLVV
ncbi:MAG: hypothetical protein A2075_02555 [Geobacteraceae bacterium GWC2_58_44]|nr:MAG: hypothetical protein A2075_02555 [Geobacteraceae bacterium GWC2_58_44]